MITAAEIPPSSPPLVTPQAPPRIPRLRPTLETRRNARRDYVQGKGTKTAIAKRFGVNVDTIKAWAKAEDWETLRRDFDAQEFEKVRVAPLPAQPPPPPVRPQDSRLARVEKELERLEIAMDKAHSDDGTANAATLRDLSASHSRLFDVWCTLTGTPRPGVRKTVKPGRSLAPIVAPTESTAQAVESQPLPE
jgi:transposase-like protein